MLVAEEKHSNFKRLVSLGDMIMVRGSFWILGASESKTSISPGCFFLPFLQSKSQIQMGTSTFVGCFRRPERDEPSEDARPGK